MNTMRHTAAVLACVSLVLSGIACDDGGEMKTDSDVPLWTLKEELRIGSHDDPEQSLTDPLVDIVISRNGHVYIPQHATGEIRQYDSSGRFIRTIGRSGSGPGEFRMLWTIGLLADTLYAFDLNPGRLSLFSLDGTHLTTRRFEHEPISENDRPEVPSELLPDGTALLLTQFTDPSDDAGHTTALLRIDRTGKVLNTLFSHSTSSSLVIPLGDSGTYHTSRPLPDYPIAAVAPDGSRMAILERYAVGDVADARTRVSRIQENAVWTVEFDQFDVPYVVRYRIQRQAN
jgi:hypothetical protein